MPLIPTILALWVCLFSLCGFASMGLDKRKAKTHKRRIPERTLFLLAILGGSPGSNLGMWVFHHKTRHWYFVAGLPLILVLQVILAVLAVRYVPTLL